MDTHTVQSQFNILTQRQVGPYVRLWCVHALVDQGSLMSCTAFQDADVQRVMLRLSKEYPGDLGILMPLMLNLLQLKPGQAFFMTVDEPHAYLRGDILEASC